MSGIGEFPREAGWYKDPLHPGYHRLFDGDSWTASVRPRPGSTYSVPSDRSALPSYLSEPDLVAQLNSSSTPEKVTYGDNYPRLERLFLLLMMPLTLARSKVKRLFSKDHRP